MNNLEKFYKQYQGEAQEYATDIDTMLQDVTSILTYKFENLDIVTQACLFLDSEEKELKEYIENMVVHYTYKRIFNKANKYFQKNKNLYNSNDIQFKDNFLDFLKQTFDLSSYQFIQHFSKELLKAILSNEFIPAKDIKYGRPSQNELSAMRKFALRENRENCYLCGVQTKNKNETEKISLGKWHKDQPSDFTKETFDIFLNSLQEHNQNLEKEIRYKINQQKTLKSDLLFHLRKNFKNFKNAFLKKKNKNVKHQNHYSALNEKTINNLFSKLYLNPFHKEFKKAYSFYNNQIMKVEHRIAVDWGGGKDEKNLLISCHKCNQKKSNITFFTEYSITKFFINEFESSKARKAFIGTLGDEALISLKIKQKFKCSDCENEFSQQGEFYLKRINDDEGYHYLNTLITCKTCLEKLNTLKDETFFDEYIKIKA